jgi:hypothetical protein
MYTAGMRRGKRVISVFLPGGVERSRSDTGVRIGVGVGVGGGVCGGGGGGSEAPAVSTADTKREAG